jgi:hypothetical protein
MLVIAIILTVFGILSLGAALLMLLLPRTRPRGKWLAWRALAASLAGVGLLLLGQSREADRLGFASLEEYQQAQAHKIADPAEWARRKPQIEAAEREARARAEQAAALAAADAARQAASRKAAEAARKGAEAAAEQASIAREMGARFVKAEDATWRQTAFITRSREAITQRLKDPESARFRNLYFHASQPGLMVTCGEVNARNSFGGYGGFKRFIANGLPETSFLETDMKRAEFDKAWAGLCQ